MTDPRTEVGTTLTAAEHYRWTEDGYPVPADRRPDWADAAEALALAIGVEL